LRTAGRTAVISGVATATAGRVARNQQRKFARETPPSKAASSHQASRTPAGSDVVASLQQLAELRASGALTEKEFVAAKAKLLAS
jgi:hypothetical protein